MPELTFEEKYKKLPPFVQEAMADEESTNINGEIADKYELNLGDTGNMVWVIAHTILGDIKPEDFLVKLKEALPDIHESVIHDIALDIATRRFYPLRDFLTGVEGVIENLGGEAPQNAELYSEKYKQILATRQQPLEETMSVSSSQYPESSIQQPVASNIIYIGIAEALQKYPAIKEQFITSKLITIKEFSQPIRATFENWLKGYREEKGAPPHSTMERTDYLFKSANAKILDNSERIILGGILRAYDEGGELPIDQDSGKIVLSELFHNNIQPAKSVESSASLPQGNVIDLRKKTD